MTAAHTLPLILRAESLACTLSAEAERLEHRHEIILARNYRNTAARHQEMARTLRASLRGDPGYEAASCLLAAQNAPEAKETASVPTLPQ